MDIEKKLDREVSMLLSKSSAVGGRKRTSVTYRQLFSDRMLMIDVIKQGVPYSLFDLIQSITPFTEGDWSAILDISPKSLKRYKQSSKTFRPIQSEKIVEMAEVAELGVEVFGDPEKFRQWMNTKVIALGNIKPKDLVTDSYGKDLVMSELHRIAHGVLA
jgi:putative toxin-antitoxin system antitoxin component (TIGR02293 family)